MLEGQFAGLRRAAEDFAEFGKSSVFGCAHLVQGFEHQPVGRFVQSKLHTDTFPFAQASQCFRVGQGDDHQVAIDETHSARETEVMQLPALSVFPQVARSVLGEETDLFARFEAMLFVGVFRAFGFDDQLVERVVIALPQPERIPTKPLPDFPGYADRFRLLSELRFLVFIFQFQQPVLLLQP